MAESTESLYWRAGVQHLIHGHRHRLEPFACLRLGDQHGPGHSRERGGGYRRPESPASGDWSAASIVASTGHHAQDRRSGQCPNRLDCLIIVSLWPASAAAAIPNQCPEGRRLHPTPAHHPVNGLGFVNSLDHAHDPNLNQLAGSYCRGSGG